MKESTRAGLYTAGAFLAIAGCFGGSLLRVYGLNETINRIAALPGAVLITVCLGFVGAVAVSVTLVKWDGASKNKSSD